MKEEVKIILSSKDWELIDKAIVGAIKSTNDAHPSWFNIKALSSLQKRIHSQIKASIKSILATK